MKAPDIDKEDLSEKGESLEEFSERVTLHGFRYLVLERGLKLVVWVLIMTFSIATCVLLSYSNFQAFVQHSHFQMESVNRTAREAQFPTVTFCLTDQASVLRYRNHSSKPFKCVEDFDLTDEQIVFCENISYYEPAQFDLDALHTSIVKAFTGNTTCMFNNVPCRLENLTRSTRVWPEKVCGEINGFEIGRHHGLTVDKPGLMKNGILIYFDLIGVSPMEDTAQQHHGVEVIVQPYGSHSFVIDESASPVYASPGSLNILDLTLKKEVLLPPPYSTSCGESPYSIITDTSYTQSNCITDCILQKLLKKCGCVPEDVEHIIDSDTRICEDDDEMVCYSKESKNIGVGTDCHTGCPLACEHEFYEVKTSQASLGDLDSIQELAEKECENVDADDQTWCIFYNVNDYKTNLIGIYVGFNSFKSYTITATASTSLPTFLGTVGGSIGMCLGFSVVTLFEFLLYIAHLVNGKLFKRRKISVQA